tara:strand:- start:2836 stop:3285 length:450 start_codon:yes stop_codon:yes gene_type:complete
MTNPRDWPQTITADFIGLFCGDHIAGGVGRQVYEYALDASKVIKVETAARSFQNVMEWETWGDLADTEHAKWLAPCRYISECGIVLIQDRVTPMRPNHKRRKLPEWLTDLTTDNYGVIGDQVVACDYGLNLLINHGAFAGALRYPKWQD